MATVTHGLQDGIDEILEKTRSLEHVITARMRDQHDESKRAIMQEALNEIMLLKATATSARAKINNMAVSLRDR